MNQKIITLLRHHDLSYIKQALELLVVLVSSEEELIDAFGMPRTQPVDDFQKLYCWAGGQFSHAMYISWWILARLVDFEVGWAVNVRRVSVAGLLRQGAEFPPEALSLHLEFLDLSNNHLTHIPLGLEQWSVDHLVLSNNDLSHVDFSLGFSSLRHLELSRNPIQKITFSPIHEQQVETLKCALETVEFSDQTYALYKESFQSLRGLRTLDFGFVQKIERQWMTDSLSRAQELRDQQDRFTITNPMMTWNPAPISGPSIIRSVSTSGSIPVSSAVPVQEPEPVSWGWVFDLPRLRSISLCLFDVEILKDCCYSQVVTRKLSGGKTLDIQSVAAVFPNLELFHVVHRALEGHTGFTRLTKLEEVSLQSCLVQRIPSELYQLPNLRTLDVSNNEISRLPRNIFKGSLERIDVWLNVLSDSACEKLVGANLWPSIDDASAVDEAYVDTHKENGALEWLQLSNQYKKGIKRKRGDLVGMLDKFKDGVVDIWQVFFGDDEDEKQLSALETGLTAYIDIKFKPHVAPNVLHLSNQSHTLARLEYDHDDRTWRRLVGGRPARVESNVVPHILKVALVQHEQGMLDISQIRQLSLDHSTITEIPEVIKEWPNLEGLSLVSTHITSLPAWLAAFPIAHIDVTNSPIASLAPEIWTKCTDMELHETNIEVQYLKGMNWHHPSIINDMLQFVCDCVEEGTMPAERIRILDFSNTGLSIIPENIAVLRSLIRLNLSNSMVKELPEVLLSQPLRYLDIKGLDIEQPPVSARTLAIDIAQCERWKDSFGEFVHLEVLDLQYQSLTEIPEQVFELPSLWRLDLRHNDIAIIPPALYKLSRLRNLLLKSNQLTEMPSEEILPISLEELDLRKNPISDSKDVEYSSPTLSIRR